MRKPRITAARNQAVAPIAAKLGDVESSLNHSMLHICKLLETIATARLSSGTYFPIELGVEATEKMGEALNATLQGYRFVVSAHQHFKRDGESAGIEVVNFGNSYECPNLMALAPAPLRVVGE